jgi:hypothetical protein
MEKQRGAFDKIYKTYQSAKNRERVLSLLLSKQKEKVLVSF